MPTTGVSDQRLRRHARQIDWILCWEEVSPRWLDALLRTGAHGAAMADAGDAEISRTFDAALAGEVWLPRRVMQWLYAKVVKVLGSDDESHHHFSSSLMSVPACNLTEHESELIGLLRHGLSNSEIAGRLGVSINTVKKHVASANEKRGLRGRRQMLG